MNYCSLLASSACGIFRQEHWRELSFPTPGDLPNPRTEYTFLASLPLADRIFTTGTVTIYLYYNKLDLGFACSLVTHYKISVDSACSHEIKGSLLLGRKAMTNLDSIQDGEHM